MFKLLKKILKKHKLKKQNNKFGYLGNNSEILLGHFGYAQNIEIKKNVRIGKDAFFDGSGGIIIESGTILGPRVTVRTSNHNYDSNMLNSIPYDEKIILEKVHIGKNVWIGDHVFICPGVSIGEGAVIGMGSVISKNIPKYAVAAGNPAKILKFRNERKYLDLKSEDQIYLKLKNNKIKI